MSHSRAILSFAVLSCLQLLAPRAASATTGQFRGVNWADSRDNFQSGVLYISGLSSADTYDSALATGTSVMTQFVSKLGANAVRMPVNEATVSTFWSTYTGAIDAVLSKGSVVLCYWDSAKTNKPPDMNAFWNMWKTVVDKYGANPNAYFEVFNEPNMYTATDLISLYSSWLSHFSSVPKSRVILDGTGDAQNVPDIGSASALDGCLLAVHDYSFFGSDTWTSESQWVSQFKGEVGSYADRTVCTEWGGPMSPGSKNGVSYGSLDYSKSPTNYFEAYIRGMSSQLHAWGMGSFYWVGLKDSDWYSMTTRSGTGSSLVLSVPNQSGLTQLQNAWTAAPTSTGGAGAPGTAGHGGNGGGSGGSGGRGGSGAGGTGGQVGGTGGSSGTGNNGGHPGGGAGGSAGAVSTGGTGTPGTGGAVVGGRGGTGGTSTSSGGAPAATGGSTGAAGSGAPPGDTPGDSSGGCSCTIGLSSRHEQLAFVLSIGAVLAAGTRRRRRSSRA